MLLPGLGVGLIGLLLALLFSMTAGAANIDSAVVVRSMFDYDPTNLDHLIVRTTRLPRVLAGVLVGIGLAVAGAIMQGLTSNPLASPGILGVNAGASLALVLGIAVMGSPPLLVYALLAVAGAAFAALAVTGLSSLSRGGQTPVKLTLAGVVFTAFASAWVTSILVLDEGTFDSIRFWTVGSLVGRDEELVRWMAPLVLPGFVGSMLIARRITTLSLGTQVATGLGLHTSRTRAMSAVLVVLLAGGAVGLAGPVGFVGLVVPHIARGLCGPDYRWIVPYSAVLGAILVLTADALGRIVLAPLEVPVGAMCAVIGAPFFVLLVRRSLR